MPLDLTQSAIGFIAISLFFIFYLLVMAEEYIHLHKSKSAILKEGIIWSMMGLVYIHQDLSEVVEYVVHHNVLEYATLLFIPH